MAEPRRVHLTTLSSAVDLAATYPSPVVPQWAPESPAKGKAADTDTVRLLFTLFEPDERAFPEFNYSELINNQKHTEEVPLSRSEEEKKQQDELAAIALKLEEKYGGKSNKKDRIQDLIDIGYGYDDEDSFIDNSEAYDEFVPASITTKLGGFYVNSGVLQFRHVSETEIDKATTENSHDLPKKRKLNGGLDKPKKKRNDDTEVEANVSPLSETLGKNERKKKKKMSTLSVTSMLKKFQKEKEQERLRLEQGSLSLKGPSLGLSKMALGPADAAGGGCVGFTDRLLNLIGSTNEQVLIQVASAVESDLDSLLDMSEDSSSSCSLPQPSTQAPLRNKAEKKNPLTTPLQTKAKETLPESVSLQQTAKSTTSTEGFPPGLEESIQKLMMATKTSDGESKVKFYTPEINSILLEIEQQCRQQSGPLRSRVYSHLSMFLPCNKETLLRRVNKLMHTHTEEPLDVDDLIKTLKEAIGKAMPEQIISWQENCEAHEQGKITKATEEENTEGKCGKKSRGPKKLFRWNEDLRGCLCNVLREKMEQYKKEKKGSQDLEEYLKTMLDNEVKPLWPKGWMPSRILLKESRKLLGLSIPVQVKKSEKRQLISNSAPPDDVLVAPAPKAGQLTVSAADPAPPPDSPLELLNDQAVAHQPPPSFSQELLAVAVAKYKQSVHKWSFTEDTKSPPLPPPPPQSSPVNFPLTGTCRLVLPRLAQAKALVEPRVATQNVKCDNSSIQ